MLFSTKFLATTIRPCGRVFKHSCIYDNLPYPTGQVKILATQHRRYCSEGLERQHGSVWHRSGPFPIKRPIHATQRNKTSAVIATDEDIETAKALRMQKTRPKRYVRSRSNVVCLFFSAHLVLLFLRHPLIVPASRRWKVSNRP